MFVFWRNITLKICILLDDLTVGLTGLELLSFSDSDQKSADAASL